MKRFLWLSGVLLLLNTCLYIAVAQRIADIQEPDDAVAVAISDENLAAAIREALDLAAAAEITTDDLLRLETLDAEEEEISDLTGIEHATNLIHLFLTDNNISDVSPLSNLTNLKTLFLADNPILDTSPLYNLFTAYWVTIDIPVFSVWDVNEDGRVDAADVALVEAAFGQSGDAIENPRTDINRDGTVDETDVQLVNNNIPVFSVWDVNEDGRVDAADVALVEAAFGQSGDAIENPRTDINRDGTVDETDVQLVNNNLDIVPDENLAATIRQTLGLAAAAEITTDDLLRLTTLDAPKRRIDDLTGLEHATNLVELNLTGNDISDLRPLTGLTTLIRLFLRENDIKDISPLLGLTDLTDVLLDVNDISDISPLAGLTNLTHLFLNRNRISDLRPLAGLTNLVQLNLRENNISDLRPLTGLTNLRELYLSENDISDLRPLAGLTTLRDLYLNENDISDIRSLAGLTNLVQLSLSENDINDLRPLAGLTSLEHLLLGGNPILDTSPIYELVTGHGVSLIIHINLSRYPPWDVNKDGRVDAADAALVEAALGQSGDAIENSRTDVNRDGTVNETDVQLVNDNIEVVLNENLAAAIRQTLGLDNYARITTADLLRLKHLNASGRQISQLTGLEHATELTVLELGSNHISDVSALSDLTKLTDLELGSNRISDISGLSGLTKLTKLDLSTNRISNINDLARLTNLHQLYLNSNNISDLSPLAGLTKLQHLELYANNISDLSPLAGLTKLSYLILIKNNISDLSPLAGLTKFHYLMLQRNNISDLSPLAGLTELLWLNLGDNKIRDVSPLKDLIIMTALWLKGNPPILDTSPLYPLLEKNGGKLNYIDIQISQYPPWDVNKDGSVDATDVALVEAALGQSGDAIENSHTDVNRDNTVDETDVQLVNDNIAQRAVVFGDTKLAAAVKKVLKVAANSIPPDEMTKLTRLTATSNQITSLSGLETASMLERLDVGQNSISDLRPLSRLTHLTQLDVANNQITDVSQLSDLTNLTTLDLRNNQITDVEPLRTLTSLTRIYIRGNNGITNLEWLATIERLRSDIKLPSIVRIPDTNLDAAVRNALRTAGNAERTSGVQMRVGNALRTAGNTISNELPMSEELLENLVALDASSKGISDLTGCEHMTALTSLDLRNNQITDVSPLSKLYSLNELRLDGNPILDTSVLRELERRGTDIDITIYRYPSWDVNQDSDVDEADVFLITATITGESPDVNGDGSMNADDRDAADANKDGNVDTDDLLLVFENFDRPVNLAAPLLSAESAGLDWRLLERIDADGLRVQLEILRAENDGSLKYQQAIAFLQAVLVALHPNQTLLLANYPNPFNPETWIPYQLARGSHVWITIYDTRGAVVRHLELGYRAEGYYRVRGRAAHWEGRNNVGERVASGLYFYQLETDDASLLRKMVILK